MSIPIQKDGLHVENEQGIEGQERNVEREKNSPGLKVPLQLNKKHMITHRRKRLQTVPLKSKKVLQLFQNHLLAQERNVENLNRKRKRGKNSFKLIL